MLALLTVKMSSFEGKPKESGRKRRALAPGAAPIPEAYPQNYSFSPLKRPTRCCSRISLTLTRIYRPLTRIYRPSTRIKRRCSNPNNHRSIRTGVRPHTIACTGVRPVIAVPRPHTIACAGVRSEQLLVGLFNGENE